MRMADVVVIGGGIIGCSIAYHLLARAGRLRVVLLEREAELGTGATARATGGIRHQFSSATLIRLTRLSFPTFLRFEEEFGRSADFVPHGYLFVTAEPDRLEGYRRAVALQQSLGVRSRILAPEEMRDLLPQLATADLLGGSFCPDDGSADPHGALQGFVTRARALGLEVLTRAEVVAIDREGERVAGVRTATERYAAPVVINAAGPFADRVARLAGVEIPSRPYRRQVLVVEPPPELPEVFPLIVDGDSGFYVHRQGRSALVMGGTDKDSRPGTEIAVDWEAFEPVLSAAAQRVPSLAEAKVMRAYAGLRDLTPDYHGILGQIPEVSGFYVACGFSGHGFMHAPAIGRLMAELIVDGRARSLDLAPLSPERFRAGRSETEAQIF